MLLLECSLVSSISTSRTHLHLQGQLCNKMKQLQDPAEANSLRCPLAKALTGLQQHTHELESCMRRKPTARPEVRVAHAKTALHARKEARLRGAGKGVGALEPWMIRRANRDGSAAQRLLTSCSDRTWCLFSG
jgi:hypothetical protein